MGAPATVAAVAAAPASARRPTLGSLRQRLLAAAALWIACALGIVGVLLVGLFGHHVEEELAGRAQGQLDAVLAELSVVMPAAQPGAAPAPAPAAPPTPPGLRLDREPPEPAFQQPLGGWYWLVAVDGQVTLRSRSWWDHPLDTLPRSALQAVVPGEVARLRSAGPGGQSLLLWARQAELAGLASPVVVAVGADTARLKDMTQSYAVTVIVALAALALALWAAAWLQVRSGLAPLRGLQAALRGIREREQRRVEGRHPDEVQPLVDELNAVLHDHDALLEQARQQAGNLAHALKTPLAVIGNAATRWPDADGELVREQLERMRRQVDWHLLRARAAARSHAAPSAQTFTPLRPVLDDLRRVLLRIHADRALAIEIAMPAAPAFAQAQATGRAAAPGAGELGLPIDPDPLKEMLGNLLDNACKWAARRIRVTGTLETHAGEPRLRLEIDDDGPGIPAERRAEALQRGRRLDERRPGSGLGLAIVDELAQIHGGSLALDATPMGGLRVVLMLPLR